MLRALALPTAFVLIAIPVRAQSHAGQHHPPQAHDPAAHPSTDSVLHAFHGTWTGTILSRRGPDELHLSVTDDSLHHATITMTSDKTGLAGSARNLRVNGDTLRWMQDVAGKACVARAALPPAESSAHYSMQGTMTCEGGDMTFTLHKNGA